MDQLELPAAKTIAAFGGVCEMERKTGRPKTTISARARSKTKRFPHWWTSDLQAIAQREGIALPEPQPRKRRKVAA